MLFDPHIACLNENVIFHKFNLIFVHVEEWTYFVQICLVYKGLMLLIMITGESLYLLSDPSLLSAHNRWIGERNRA